MKDLDNYIIDTNIFLRIIVKDNEQSFTECLELIKLIKTNKIKAAVPSIVLAEIVWTLSSYYKFTRDVVAENVLAIYNINGLRVAEGGSVNDAIVLYKNSKAKFVDCMIACLPEIKEKKWGVISYDKDFDLLGVRRKLPGEVLQNIKD